MIIITVNLFIVNATVVVIITTIIYRLLLKNKKMFPIIHWLKEKLPTFLGLNECNYGEIEDVLNASKKQ